MSQDDDEKIEVLEAERDELKKRMLDGDFKDSEEFADLEARVNAIRDEIYKLTSPGENT